MFPKVHNTFRAPNVGRESELLLPVKDTGDLWRARDRILDAASLGRLSARKKRKRPLPSRFSRLSSFVSILPFPRDNKVTSSLRGNRSFPLRNCRLQLFNRHLDDTFLLLFERGSARAIIASLDGFLPSFLRVIMARDEFEVYANGKQWVSRVLLVPPAYLSIDSLLHGFRLSLGEFAKFGWRLTFYIFVGITRVNSSVIVRYY